MTLVRQERCDRVAGKVVGEPVSRNAAPAPSERQVIWWQFQDGNESMDVMNEIRAAFARRGNEGYGEGVSQLDHAVQCAAFAQRDGAGPALVAAAYLHDIGHLLHDLPQDIADSGVDTQHEATGSAWLSQYFGPELTEPVRMHVAAKRYLAATEPGYLDLLSDASKLSLRLQGGPMSATQVRAFEAEPFFADAIRLRRWDEEGKIVGFRGPPVAHFEAIVATCIRLP